MHFSKEASKVELVGCAVSKHTTLAFSNAAALEFFYFSCRNVVQHTWHLWWGLFSQMMQMMMMIFAKMLISCLLSIGNQRMPSRFSSESSDKCHLSFYDAFKESQRTELLGGSAVCVSAAGKEKKKVDSSSALRKRWQESSNYWTFFTLLYFFPIIRPYRMIFHSCFVCAFMARARLEGIPSQKSLRKERNPIQGPPFSSCLTADPQGMKSNLAQHRNSENAILFLDY